MRWTKAKSKKRVQVRTVFCKWAMRDAELCLLYFYFKRIQTTDFFDRSVLVASFFWSDKPRRIKALDRLWQSDHFRQRSRPKNAWKWSALLFGQRWTTALTQIKHECPGGQTTLKMPRSRRVWMYTCPQIHVCHILSSILFQHRFFYSPLHLILPPVHLRLHDYQLAIFSTPPTTHNSPHSATHSISHVLSLAHPSSSTAIAIKHQISTCMSVESTALCPFSWHPKELFIRNGTLLLHPLAPSFFVYPTSHGSPLSFS